MPTMWGPPYRVCTIERLRWCTFAAKWSNRAFRQFFELFIAFCLAFNSIIIINILMCWRVSDIFLFSRFSTTRPSPADTQIESDYDILPLHAVVCVRPLSARHVWCTAYFDSLPLMCFPFNSISAHSSTHYTNCPFFFLFPFDVLNLFIRNFCFGHRIFRCFNSDDAFALLSRIWQ